MKKFLCLLSAVLFAFTSCSKDDNDSSDGVLVKRITNFKNDQPTTSEFLYDGNKIVSVTGKYSTLKYTYSGDFISKEEEFDKSGKLVATTDYTYSNGKLASSAEKGLDKTIFKTKYTHNADGTITYEDFEIDSTTGSEVKGYNKGVFTFKNGNLIKDEAVVGSNQTKLLITYEYDAKNNPFKNVLGYNLLVNNREDASVNNTVKIVRTYGSEVITHIVSYEYNSKNYPTKKIDTHSGSSTRTETTEYSY